MSTLFLFVCLLVGCLAQESQPCSSPPLMSGSLSVSTQSEKLAAFSKYSYDGLGRRIRLSDFGSIDNKTFHLDVLLLYKQGVMYKINNRDKKCMKRRLSTDFIPLGVPKDAYLVGQFVMGSSSVPGDEILVNTWTGKLLTKRGLDICRNAPDIQLESTNQSKEEAVLNVRDHGYRVWMHSCQHPV
ncbi:ependymin-2-like isoform X2 [Gambusia affinis]|uniref:ependymin-2-like isoform X2 n=1 Tax=Gambusia affinis TaxID=33528 RepID=UPI001CDC8911|nr:ependymin-2-like isoform X2 [Gambusia affinis]